jgi:hypothetical protein
LSYDRFNRGGKLSGTQYWQLNLSGNWQECLVLAWNNRKKLCRRWQLIVLEFIERGQGKDTDVQEVFF